MYILKLCVSSYTIDGAAMSVYFKSEKTSKDKFYVYLLM